MNNATPEQLRNAINEMDGMAQSAFGQIASMAALALLSMEQPSAYANGASMDHVANMLESIKGMANDMDNCINATAEGVGCNYVDDAQQRRRDASRKARKSNTAGGLEPWPTTPTR